MTIAALVTFGVLLASWLLAPAERNRQSHDAPQPMHELPAQSAEAQAA